MRPILEHTITVEGISRLVGVKVDLDHSLVFSGATSNDGDVVEGDLFLAYPGVKTHGARFASSAISRGARAIVTDAEGGKIAEAQATAEGATYDEEGLLRLLRLARIGCTDIFAAQAKAAGR